MACHQKRAILRASSKGRKGHKGRKRRKSGKR
jgi:hypothetical protein